MCPLPQLGAYILYHAVDLHFEPGRQRLIFVQRAVVAFVARALIRLTVDHDILTESRRRARRIYDSHLI